MAVVPCLNHDLGPRQLDRWGEGVTADLYARAAQSLGCENGV